MINQTLFYCIIWRNETNSVNKGEGIVMCFIVVYTTECRLLEYAWDSVTGDCYHLRDRWLLPTPWPVIATNSVAGDCYQLRDRWLLPTPWPVTATNSVTGDATNSVTGDSYHLIV